MPTPRLSRVDIQRQCVYPTHQIRPKRGMHRPVPRDTRHRTKGLRADHHVKMRLTTFPPAAMAPVAFAIVHNLQCVGLKSRSKTVGYFIADTHFSLSTPLVIRKNT